MVPIESDGHVRRARRTAAWARVAIGLTGIALIAARPGLLDHPLLGVTGFATIVATAAVHLWARRVAWLKFEESLAAAAAILIVGLGGQHVTALSILWLAAVASGVMARGGRVHWIGRAVVLSALALPILLEGRLSLEHAGLCIAAIALLLTIGRLTVELNHLLWQARWDADHDGLTGLLSRTAFRAALDVAGAGASARAPVSLLLFDLDGFGAINKTAGHARGDELLTTFAATLQAQTPPGAVSGRLGGDEFAILLADGDALAFAQRLLAELPQATEDARGISTCAGVAQAPSDGSDSEALLRAADIALRVAKRAPGGGQVSVYSGGSLSGDGRTSARGALRRAIDGDGLTTVVQPIVDVRSGSIHAYEALSRFGPDASGSPLQWFSLADELGEREALERACLREALELFCRRPPGVSLSVNLSAPVLLDRSTLRMLEPLRDLSGLIIEITEDALVLNDRQLASAIAPLQARGAQMAVDDMGAGYSGLGQIMAVHPRYLKLDRSLIKGIDEDLERAALVGALADYATRVGSLLVAEGMESEAELRTLIELGVPLAQGFYLSRPARPWPTVAPHLLSFGAAVSRDARAFSASAGSAQTAAKRPSLIRAPEPASPRS
ncbi:MAG TPA: EAL domain-containing protein [Solirubrobacteraceae bacterium]|jgi:diguanylate cyclase (GGDEF)-like protein|nr:EAL domain-containing protein [Solirubrobacteraceae bacterium]